MTRSDTGETPHATDTTSRTCKVSFDASVILLNLNRRGSYTIDNEDGEAASRFRREIRRFGYQPEEVSLVHCEIPVATFDWPRNVSWKSLPIILDPAYRHYYSCPAGTMSEMRAKGDRSRKSYSGRKLTTPNAKVVVVASPELAHRILYEIAVLIAAEGCSAQIMHFDGHVLRSVGDGEIAHAREIHAPHDRFVYNHALNLLVIGGRAYVKASRERGESQDEVEKFMPRLHDFHWQFGHPFCIQLLFELAHTREKATRWISSEPQQVDWVWVNRLPLFRPIGDGHQFIWPGTGRFPSWQETIQHVPEYNTQSDIINRDSLSTVLRWMETLTDAGLVGIGDAGSICLSNKGRRFLELIGPALSDPDLLLRWRTAEGTLCSAVDVPSVDRWLNKAFRRVKRRVSGLDPSPVDEDTALKWPVFRDNVLLVRGVRIEIPRISEFDARMARLVEDAVAVSETVDLKHCRLGVVRQSKGFGEDVGDISAVWIGIPLAVTRDSWTTVADFETLADWRGIDEEVASLTMYAEHCPGATIETHAIREPFKDVETLRIPPRLIEKGKTTFPVVYGKILAIPDILQAPEELRTYIKYQSIGQKMNGIPKDGICISGKGRRWVVSVGIQVGALDMETATLVMDTKYCHARAEYMDRMFEGAVTGASNAVLRHPELSKKKYWLIGGNGTAREMRLENTAESQWKDAARAHEGNSAHSKRLDVGEFASLLRQ